MPNSLEQGRHATSTLLRSQDPPTAILAMSDTLAAGALQAAADLGLSVPADLSVVGFDDSSLAEQTSPPLTTIAQSQERKGEDAARLLLRGIDGSQPLNAATRIVLPHELVVRGTTGPAPR
jgi:DNA-binding LacI/PurR family transcriptional regulator